MSLGDEMYMRRFMGSFLFVTVAACSTALPPPELVDARRAYDRASHGMAPQLAPAQLDTAKQALTEAERNFHESGADDSTKDLAYVAERKALIAESEAVRAAAERDKGEADKRFKDAQIEGLDLAKRQLTQERQAREKTKAELETEKHARGEAEKKAAAAMASLQEIAKVKEESRGMVITLSGSVLFAPGKYDLLPIAKDKLDEVAKAVADQKFNAITVEGHTDSVGKATDNDTLSLKRAEAVRTHLVSQGIPGDKIKAVGLGSTRPIADNKSADGRANNRRVELIVEPFK